MEIADFIWDIGFALKDDNTVISISVFDCIFEFLFNFSLRIALVTFSFNGNSLTSIIQFQNKITNFSTFNLAGLISSTLLCSTLLISQCSFDSVFERFSPRFSK
ncbi:hypothetical protein D8Y22_18470 [Salinadaptatus halalkaliphilus]|uniref:Uncharacterized protein n=1 Tax=Salinadaptatus halalkaliphilus TaxID=2419781 RepID=A0A4V3VKW9_9EURY|nr:hypothetical protein D8Y22_18470 [Salinadaptatus halalkaliphilus]